MQSLVLVGTQLLTLPEYDRWYNEVYRKSVPSRVRTTSVRRRAGSRRTKHEAQRD